MRSLSAFFGSPLTWLTSCVLLLFTALAFKYRNIHIHRKHEKTLDPSTKASSSATAMEKPALHQDIQVSKILIHPIKSCRGTSVRSCRYTPEGLENDRRFCIIEADTHKLITAREVGKMVLISPRIEVDEKSPHGGVLSVSFPEESGCESFSVPLHPVEEKWQRLSDIWYGAPKIDGFICESESSSGRSPSEILSGYFERPVHLAVKGNRPRPCDATDLYPSLKATAWYQDQYPLLVLSEESIDVLHEEIRSRVGTQGIEDQWSTQEFQIERFRPNIVLRGAGPFAEDNFAEISIGVNSENAGTAPGILLVSKCVRCLLPNVSPDTGVRDKAVPYKLLMKFRIGLDRKNKMSPCVGCHGVPLESGLIEVGNSVAVRKYITV